MAKRVEKRERRSAVLAPDAADIDSGAHEIYVAVPPDRDEQTTRRFSSFTHGLHGLAIGWSVAGIEPLRWSLPA